MGVSFAGWEPIVDAWTFPRIATAGEVDEAGWIRPARYAAAIRAAPDRAFALLRRCGAALPAVAASGTRSEATATALSTRTVARRTDLCICTPLSAGLRPRRYWTRYE